MIIEGVVLHDFGVYNGRQSLDLSPVAPDGTIVLVGGLNGRGKTTLLEALQLCLYGPAAPTARRAAGGYLEHLRRRIHRGSGARGASVEVSFRHASYGVENKWRVIRSWVAPPGNPCRETLEVLRDDRLDALATANWGERVEEFLPVRIAELFFFDGEKVEAYADPEEAPALIATALHNLLGLDVVERLGMDLAAFERRVRTGLPEAQATAATDARRELELARDARAARVADAAEARMKLDRAARALETVEDRFRREGGDLYEKRTAIESDAVLAARRLSDAERDARDGAGGAAPLLMVADLVNGARARAHADRDASQAASLLGALDQDHAAILALPEIQALPASPRAAVAKALRARRHGLAKAAVRSSEIGLTTEQGALLDALATGEFQEARERTSALVARVRDAREALSVASATLAAAPDAGALDALLADRSALRAERGRSEAALRDAEEAAAAAEREAAQLAEREARISEEDARTRHQAEDAGRALSHSARVRGSLIRFREAVVQRHVTRIEALILDSFRSLVRKEGLVSGLRIDPGDYALSLSGADGRPLLPNQLSAGERQLLSVAILWGLAKAAGRPLPTVIDTFLGRLDSVHRTRLIERYLPFASHQVVLLSTDQEISGGYLDLLAPYVARTYRLEFDDRSGATSVVEGYLENPRHVA